MNKESPSYNKKGRSELRSLLNLPRSINDLRDKEFEGKTLTKEEKRALKAFDEYRIEYLDAAKNEEDFHERFLKLQARANLDPYQEFLSGKK